MARSCVINVKWPNVPKLSHGGKPALEEQNKAATAVGSGEVLGHMVEFHKSCLSFHTSNIKNQTTFGGIQ